MSNDKINSRSLDPWVPPELIKAAKLNQPVDVLNAQAGVSPPEQVINSGGGFQMRRFIVIRLERDVIICHTPEFGTNEIKVAMPYLLRKTPFDSEGQVTPALRKGKFKYTFNFFEDDKTTLRFDKRTSIDTSNDDDEEIQVIVGAYEENDQILGVTGIIGGTGLFHDEEEQFPVLWMDPNTSRYWALSSEEEEEEAS